MKRILAAALMVPLVALAQSYPSPTYQNLTVLGTFTLSGGIPPASLAAQAANTVVANATASSASPTAIAMPSCSTASSALNWTTSGGSSALSCNTAINAATLGGATFAVPSPIGSTTASTGAFTTLSASGAVSGTGFSTYLASPPAIGGTAASPGSFTTLSASSTVSGSGFSTYLASPPAVGGTTPNTGKFTVISTTAQSKVVATTTNALSVPNNAFTTVTTWTAALNQGGNFVASTGVYTTPAAGTYDVRFNFRLASAALTAGNGIIAAVFNNGVEVYQTVVPAQAAATLSVGASISAILNCASGDLITVRVFQNSGGAVALDGNAADNWLMISQLP